MITFNPSSISMGFEDLELQADDILEFFSIDDFLELKDYFNYYKLNSANYWRDMLEINTETFIRQLISNKPLTIVGDGTQKRDFLYITDLCRAF